MPPFFFFGHLQYFIGRIPQYPVEHTASGILPVLIALMRQPKHFPGQLNGTSNILVAWFFQFSSPLGWQSNNLSLTDIDSFIKSCANTGGFSVKFHQTRAEQATGGMGHGSLGCFCILDLQACDTSRWNATPAYTLQN
jgi:hypothetical protein